MDQLLLPYIEASDETARKKYLEELLLFHAQRVVRRTLLRRLGFSVGTAGTNRFNHDAEDLYQDIITKVTQALHDLRTSPTKPTIKNFERYVGRVATNVCNDFLRVKLRPRFLLKHRLEDLLRRHPDFAIWKYRDTEVCGLSYWRQTTAPIVSPTEIRDIESDLGSFRAAHLAGRNITLVPFITIVHEFFKWIGRPIELDAVAGVLSTFSGVPHTATESITGNHSAVMESVLADSRLRADSAYEAKALLMRLWKLVQTLPASQRDTFCFGFEDESGTDLFTLLLNQGLVTLPELAEGLNRSLQDLVRLRALVPMDSLTIAAELNATRPQVLKWRFRALQRLRKELLV
jgi:RNA polymerase sigma factor (sigma-70 family)